MKFPKLSEQDRQLKLAILAELSQKNAKGHYLLVIRNTHNLKKANAARAKLAAQSTNPWGYLKAEYSYLARNPEILAPLALEAYARQGDNKLAERMLQDRRFRAQPAAATLNRHIQYKKFVDFQGQIRKQRLNTSTPNQLKKTLTARVRMLNEADQWVNRAARSNDWTLQILALDLVKSENDRLHKSLLGLPSPAGLNKLQRQDYQKLLAQQAQPYFDKSQFATKQLDTLWNNTTSVRALISDINTARGSIRRLIAREISWLEPKAPSSIRQELREAIQEATTVARSQIVSVMSAAQKDPFNVSRIQDFRKVAQRAGHDTMVAYLDARIEQLTSSRRTP